MRLLKIIPKTPLALKIIIYATSFLLLNGEILKFITRFIIKY